MTDSDLPEVKVSVTLYSQALPDDRKVGVGFTESARGPVYCLCFENKGIKTDFCLSEEAFKAMVKLAKLAKRQSTVKTFVWKLIGDFKNGVWTEEPLS